MPHPPSTTAPGLADAGADRRATPFTDRPGTRPEAGLPRGHAAAVARGGGIGVRMGIVALATMLGLVLRVAAAGGDLGIDEAWSLRLVEGVRHLGGVVWGLSHDNSHLLNSAWLYGLGPDRPVWAYRLPAIVLGTVTVPAAFRWLARIDPAAGCFGALLAAVALPLVDFGSEARGYAGLALATVLAIDEAGRATDDALRLGGRSGARWRLAFAVGFGLLSHLAMVNTVALVGLVALVQAIAATRRARPTARAMIGVFGPSLLLAVPACAVFVAGIVLRGEFHIGDVVPFSMGTFAQGFGGMILLTAGVPDIVPGGIGIVLTVAGLPIVARRRLLAPRSLHLALAALVVFPLAVAAARLPNVGYARYFAACGLVVMGLEAEVLGAVWRRGGAARRQAVLAAMIPVVGSLALDRLEIRDGRGGFSDTLAVMRSGAAPTYATDRPVMAEMLLGAAARRQAVAAPILVAESDICRATPNWYVTVGLYDPRPDGTITVGPAACRRVYRARKAYGASALSGTQWTLYQKG